MNSQHLIEKWLPRIFAEGRRDRERIGPDTWTRVDLHLLNDLLLVRLLRSIIKADIRRRRNG